MSRVSDNKRVGGARTPSKVRELERKFKRLVQALQDIDKGAYAHHELAGDIARRALRDVQELSFK